MASKGLAGLLAASWCLLFTTLARAECKMDNDCAGDLVCEAEQCVAPAPLPPAPPPPTTAAAPAGPPRASIAAEPHVELRELAFPKPKMRRHSTAMMVGGIVMTSIGAISLLVSATSSLNGYACDAGGPLDSSGGGSRCGDNDAGIYTALVLGLGLVAGGVPMIVIGAKREPAGYASLTPWAAPHAGGLSLRLEL